MKDRHMFVVNVNASNRENVLNRFHIVVIVFLSLFRLMLLTPRLSFLSA